MWRVLHTVVKIAVASLIVGTVLAHFGITFEALSTELGISPERLEQAVLPWLLKSTAIHVRPSESATIVDGMVRRTLRVVDRNHMESTE